MEMKMPHSKEAEQAVLGIVFLDFSSFSTIVDIIEANDFYFPQHQVIFKAMFELFSKNLEIDVTTLKNILAKNDLLDKCGGIEYIGELATSVPSSSNLESYINIVRDKSLTRKVINVSKEAVEKGYTDNFDTSEFIDQVEKKLFEVTKQRRSGEFRRIAPVLDNVVEGIEKNSTTVESVTGLKTGFNDVDRITFGFQREDLMILAARPGVGKTAFALNLAINVAKLNDSSVAIFSMEMSAEQLVSRILSRESGVNSEYFKTGQLNENQWSSIHAAVNKLKKQNVYFDDGSGTNINELRAKCRKLKQETNLDFIIIDYLQLMSGGTQFGGNRQQEVSYISRTLKEVARELKVPILALSQLSRQLESREDKRPKLSDLRESGSIEQDADIVMFLYREDYHNKETEKPNVIELNFAKNRHGSNGVAEFRFEKECSMFNTIAPDYREKDTNDNIEEDLEIIMPDIKI